MRLRAWFILGAVLAVCIGRGDAAGAGAPPKVRAERPRIFLRAKPWDGPSVEKIRERMSLPEYRERAGKLHGKGQPMSDGLLWLLERDREAGVKAVTYLKSVKLVGVKWDSTTNEGHTALYAAALYDWLHDHPDFDETSRLAVLAEFERWGDRCVKYLKGGGETPFYCRLSAMFSGLTVVGLAIAGDSPRAEEFIGYAKAFLTEKFGTIRQMEDGATGGGSYGYNWEFTHLANMVSAWRSASDWDAADWIAKNQGDWLRRQMYFQIWMTYPSGQFFKDGDLWAIDQSDHSQYRMHIDAITGMYRDGFGRTWADAMYKRHGIHDYHSEFVWQFYVYNDPEVKPRPMADLGRSAVFSPKLHGFVCWRDSWADDATIVHFKCGDNVDHHATYDSGKFTLYKRTPLAIKSGAYIGYKTPHHMYYKSPWSANCVVFTGPRNDGLQPFVDFDGTPSWPEWAAHRNYARRPSTGVLLATEANDRWARAVGDLSGACPAGTRWTRELVFLGWKYLVVLDRVRAGPEIRHRWTLHTINEPAVEGATAVADNGPSRLFCRTLLPVFRPQTSEEPSPPPGPGDLPSRLVSLGPRGARLTKIGGPGHEFDYNGSNRPPKDPRKQFVGGPQTQVGAWRLDVEPADGAAECVYLHVLVPTAIDTAAMPPCAVERRDGGLVVRVGELEYAFGEREARGE